MKTINEHIKTRNFKSIYLLYGEEAYLRNQYRDKLVTALCPDGDEMNRTRFEGKGISTDEVISLAETLPFFAERRVIIIEDSGWFKSGNQEMEAFLDNIPDTTVFLFVEEQVDERIRLFKTVKNSGYAANMKKPTDSELIKWIGVQCRKEGKKMEEAAARFLVEQAGTNMHMLQMELEKIFSYTMERDSITLDDVLLMCSNQVENQIYKMLDAIGNRDRERALSLYHDLLALREPAMSILSKLTWRIHTLLQVSEMTSLHMAGADIAAKAGLRPFAVKLYQGQIRLFSRNQLLEMLEACQETEAGIKRGIYQDVIGLELLIVEFSSKPKQ